MTVHDEAIAKIRQLPEPLVQEVSDFLDSLLTKIGIEYQQIATQSLESQDLAEGDLSDYLPALEAYEDDLSTGKVLW